MKAFAIIFTAVLAVCSAGPGRGSRGEFINNIINNILNNINNGGGTGGTTGGTTATTSPLCNPTFNSADITQSFTDAMSTVPNPITNLPPKGLIATFTNDNSATVLTAPGSVVTTDQAQNFPVLDFGCERGKLYTAMIYDTSPGFFQGLYQNMHCLKGVLDITYAQPVFEYIPSFAFGEQTLADGTVTLDTNPEPTTHLILAYEQPGVINITPKLQTCSPGQSFARVLVSKMIYKDTDNILVCIHFSFWQDFSVNPPTPISPDTIAAKYNLTPVAGNYFFNIYSGESTNKEICALLACEDDAFLTGFTTIIPGVNNIPSAVAAGEPNCVDQYGITLWMTRMIYDLNWKINLGTMQT